MRFIITILCILGLAFFAVRRCAPSKDGTEPKSIVATTLGAFRSESADEKPLSIVPGSIGEKLDGSADDSVAIQPAFSSDKNITRRYTFKHREIPDGLSQLSTGNQSLIILADAFTRTVSVTGDPLSVQTITEYLAAIDLVPGSCGVQTWAVFVDRSLATGWDLVAAINSIVPTSTAAELGNGAFTLNIGSGDLSSALAVIADGSSVEVLQRPHVLLEHGAPSRIESIQEVPVPSTAVSQGISQTSIEYRKVGLQLTVTPRFLDRDRVRLEIAQSNGLIGQTVNIDGNEIPIIQSQAVATTATLTVGQTIILGGVSTIRQSVVKGLLRDKTELSEGSLYLVLTTFHPEPKALPVVSPFTPDPFGTVPLAQPDPDASEWILDGLLPSKGSIPHK